jgi:hypothetical protein
VKEMRDEKDTGDVLTVLGEDVLVQMTQLIINILTLENGPRISLKLR